MPGTGLLGNAWGLTYFDESVLELIDPASPKGRGRVSEDIWSTTTECPGGIDSTDFLFDFDGLDDLEGCSLQIPLAKPTPKDDLEGCSLQIPLAKPTPKFPLDVVTEIDLLDAATEDEAEAGEAGSSSGVEETEGSEESDHLDQLRSWEDDCGDHFEEAISPLTPETWGSPTRDQDRDWLDVCQSSVSEPPAPDGGGAPGPGGGRLPQAGETPRTTGATPAAARPKRRGSKPLGVVLQPVQNLPRRNRSFQVGPLAAEVEDPPDEACAPSHSAGGCLRITTPSATQRRGRCIKGMLRRPTSCPPTLHPKGFRVAFVINGSLGDVQPMVALARRLMQMHHKVRIFTNVDHMGFCRTSGVDAVPVFADCAAVISSIGGMSGPLQVWGSCSLLKCKRAAEAWQRGHPGACISADDALEDFKPTAIVSGSQASGPALRYEHRMAVPVMYAYFSESILEFSKSFMGCAPPRPQFYAVSPVFDRLPAGQYPSCLLQTPDWVVGAPVPAAALADPGSSICRLRKFLAAGPPPVAIGWGSMLAEGLPPAAMLGLALKVLHAAGRRGVILGGWARLDVLGEQLVSGRLGIHEMGRGHPRHYELGRDADMLAGFAAANVCFVDSVPHSWLIPQCSCAIHHGGAGTTQAVLRAGRPAVITPIFGDQFSNGQRLSKLGVGVAFNASLPEITLQELVNAIYTAERETPLAEVLGSHLRSEDGAADASRIVDGFLRNEVDNGRWAALMKKAHAATAAGKADIAAAIGKPPARGRAGVGR